MILADSRVLLGGGGGKLLTGRLREGIDPGTKVALESCR